MTELQAESTIYDLTYLFDNEVRESPHAKEILEKTGIYKFIAEKYGDEIAKKIPSEIWLKFQDEKSLTKLFTYENLVKYHDFTEDEIEALIESNGMEDYFESRYVRPPTTGDYTTEDLVDILEERAYEDGDKFDYYIKNPERFLKNRKELYELYQSGNIKEFLIEFGRTFPSFKYIDTLIES